MPEYHITRFDQMTQAVDVFAAVETGGDGTTPGPVRVPQGVGAIKRLRVVLANSTSLATDTGVVFTLRLTGNGLKDGQQDFVCGSTTINLEATGAGGFAAFQNAPYEIDCNLPVQPGNDINISAAMRGVDVGTPEIGVELVFV